MGGDVCEQSAVPGKSKRNASVEVFRCLMMFSVVFWHCWSHGIYQEANASWMLLFALLYWHVDGFLVISGWYSIRFSWRKFISLYSQILFYSILSFAYLKATGQNAHFTVTGGWFGGTYLMLLLIVPLLNLAVETLSKRSKQDIWRIWGLFALAMFLSWAPRHLYTSVEPFDMETFGFLDGTIVMMAFVYVTVRLFRLLDLKLSKRLMFAGVCLFVLCTIGIGMVISFCHTRTFSEWSSYRIYCSFAAPHFVLMAIVAFVFFKDYVRIPKWLERGVIFLSPSMFGVYLFHDTTSFCRVYLIQIEEWLSGSMSALPTMICSAMIVFAISVCVDLVRRLIFFLTKRCVGVA